MFKYLKAPTSNNVIVAEIPTVNLDLSPWSSQVRGYLPAVKQQVSEMIINGSGIRDTARMIKISPATVIETLKKSCTALNKYLQRYSNNASSASICNGGVGRRRYKWALRWSFVQSKKQQQWLWQAIAHRSGKPTSLCSSPA